MPRQNKQWQDFRNQLLKANYRTLWSIEGKPQGLSFDLVCMLTDKGATIFQVWKDSGFACYIDDTSPHKLDELLAFLGVKPT